MADIVELRASRPSPRRSKELTERLTDWSGMFLAELGRNDYAPSYWRESAVASYEAGLRCVEAAAGERERDPELFEALIGAASKYFVGAQIKFARAEELRA